MYIARASEASGVDRGILSREVNDTGGRNGRTRPASPPTPPAPEEHQEQIRMGDRRAADRRESAQRPPPRVGPSVERYLLRVILAHPAYLEMAAEADVGPDTFQDARYREIFETLTTVGADAPPEIVIKELSPDAAAAYDQMLGEPPESIVNLELTYRHTIARVRTRELKNRNEEINRLMATARDEEKNALLAEILANKQKARALQVET
jgi:hypothetical protein